jgi:hypothetical protein
MMRLGLPIETVSDDPLPGEILGYISVRGPQSVFDPGATTLTTSAGAYEATSLDRAEVSRNLQSEGFTIIAESPLGVSVSGPPGAYDNLTGGTVVARERLSHAEAGYHLYKTHLDITGEQQPKRFRRRSCPTGAREDRWRHTGAAAHPSQRVSFTVTAQLPQISSEGSR